MGTFPGIKQITIKNSIPIDQNDIFNDSDEAVEVEVEMKSVEEVVNIPQVIDDEELIIEEFED